MVSIGMRNASYVLHEQDLPEQHAMRSSTHGPDNRTFAGRQSFAIFSTVAAQTPSQGQLHRRSLHLLQCQRCRRIITPLGKETSSMT